MKKAIDIYLFVSFVLLLMLFFVVMVAKMVVPPGTIVPAWTNWACVAILANTFVSITIIVHSLIFDKP
jgi:hypothetical protein